MQICTTCKVKKDFSQFYKSHKSASGLKSACKECSNSMRNELRRTKDGVISRMYEAQISNSKKRGHDKPSYTKDEFRTWILSQDLFHTIYEQWKSSDYITALKPSCDRNDDTQRYALDRLSVMTWGENRSKAHCQMKEGSLVARHQAVIQMSLEGEKLNEYISAKQASRDCQISHSSILAASCGKRKTAGGFRWARE